MERHFNRRNQAHRYRPSHERGYFKNLAETEKEDSETEEDEDEGGFDIVKYANDIINGKLTDVRIVNNELKTLLGEVKKEYWMMVCLVVCNIPLLYVLNKDWYDALMFTLPGKIVLAICGVVILITAVLMMKYTRPVEYKR